MKIYPAARRLLKGRVGAIVSVLPVPKPRLSIVRTVHLFIPGHLFVCFWSVRPSVAPSSLLFAPVSLPFSMYLSLSLSLPLPPTRTGQALLSVAQKKNKHFSLLLA